MRTRSRRSACGCASWVSFHGIAINVEPDLSHFSGHRALRRGGPTLWRHLAGRSRPPRRPWPMSTSRSGRRLPRCSGQRKPACRKHDVRLIRPPRSSARPPACRRCSAAPGSGRQSRRHRPDLVDMQIGLMVQRPEQFAHAPEDRGDIIRLLVLGVGALADMDVDPEAGELLLGERSAAGEPVGRIDGFDDDRGDLGILAQDFCGEFGDGGGDVRLSATAPGASWNR